MSPSLPRFPRFLALHVLALGALGLMAADALAQPAAAPSAKPETPSPEIQRRIQMGGYHPERMNSQGLSGHPPKLTVTPLEELPLQHLQVPPDFKIEVWAHGFPGGRMMTRGEKGTIFMGTRNIGRVYAIMEKNGTRTAKIVIDKLVQPNGVLFHNGSLYVAAINQVLRFDNIEGTLDNIPQPVDMTEAFQLPPEVHHNWKFLAYGPDKNLPRLLGWLDELDGHPSLVGGTRPFGTPDAPSRTPPPRGERRSRLLPGKAAAMRSQTPPPTGAHAPTVPTSRGPRARTR